MQPVSSAYNAYPHTRHVSATVTFGVVAPDAAATAQATASESATISQIAQTHNDVERFSAKYASLEPDIWALDGTFDILPDDTSTVEVGWWSDAISEADCVFTTPPSIRYDFPEPQKSYGFTLVFDQWLPDDYPTEIQVTTYGANGTQMVSKTFYPDNWTYVIDLPAKDYLAVVFAFKRTKKPQRRIRLCNVVFGMVYKYDKNSISDLRIMHEIDPLALSLPSSEMSVTINNAKKLYNMANPNGLFAFLQNGQVLDTDISIDGESINMGRTYFTSAKSTDGALTTKITANDRMLLLDNKEYGNGKTGTWTLLEAVTDILLAAGLGITVVIPSGLNTTIRKCIPQKTKCREALRLACQAARCTCFIDREDRLVFVRPVLSAPVDTLSRDRMADEAQIEIINTTNTVKLTVKDDYTNNEQVYTANGVEPTDYERAEEINNPLVVDGQAVANWLLEGLKRHTQYKAQSRGNPAVEPLDTILVHDYYGVNNNVMITSQEFVFDGGLEADVVGLQGGAVT